MAKIIQFLVIISFLSGTEACADIYKYVTEDGVECFTDSPTHKDAVLVLKDYASPRKRPSKTSPTSRQQVPAYMKKNAAAAAKAEAAPADFAGNLPVHGRITSVVGLRNDPIDGMLRFHKGIDISVPEGTPVKPVAAGTVVYSGFRSGYGNTIIVEHPDGMTTIYAHHSANLASFGQQVDRDTVIALSGSTGRSTGPHLHFEAWKDGENITPEFLTDAGGGQANSASREISNRQNRVRTAILPDGSILFTNYPLSHP
ncbi:MAG TPA: M23 family metallopeptidase [Geobacteraceae bacterium]|nr:M23 family metallopeptidase [Geobacteraceae bacterium]